MWLVSFDRARRADASPASIGAARLGFETLEGVAQGSRRLGAILTAGPRAGCVVDLNRALAVKLAAEDVGAPEAEADSLLPADAQGFLRRWPGVLDAARDVLSWVEAALQRYDAPDLRAAGVVTARRGVRLAPPVPRPGKLIAVESNYAAPGLARPVRPELFLVASSAVAGPEDGITLLPDAPQVHFQGGLAAVIGRVARGVPPERALDCVAGYCVAIDFTASDNLAGFSDLLARSRDGSTPLGPALVTCDEIPDPQDLGIRMRRSRETLQVGRTKEMLFSVADLLAFASTRLTLEPGDLLLTGGLPSAPGPPRALRDGDVVEVEIERVGKLSCYVRVAASGV